MRERRAFAQALQVLKTIDSAAARSSAMD